MYDFKIEENSWQNWVPRSVRNTMKRNSLVNPTLKNELNIVNIKTDQLNIIIPTPETKRF